jgi:hypothetical protein
MRCAWWAEENQFQKNSSECIPEIPRATALYQGHYIHRVCNWTPRSHFPGSNLNAHTTHTAHGVCIVAL